MTEEQKRDFIMAKTGGAVSQAKDACDMLNDFMARCVNPEEDDEEEMGVLLDAALDMLGMASRMVEKAADELGQYPYGLAESDLDEGQEDDIGGFNEVGSG